MSTVSQTPQSPAAKQNRRKKVRAVMASGLVLGVGAAVTLAAWSDTAWGVGNFGMEKSAFNVQATFDGGTSWDEFLTDKTAGTMNFGANAAKGLMPGESVYALVGLKEQKNNMGAKLSLTKVTGDTSAIKDLVSVKVTTPSETKPDCATAATYGTAVNLSAANAKMLTDVELPAGKERWVCFAATLDAKTPPHTPSVNAIPIEWKFDAVSVDKTPAPAQQ